MSAAVARSGPGRTGTRPPVAGEFGRGTTSTLRRHGRPASPAAGRRLELAQSSPDRARCAKCAPVSKSPRRQVAPGAQARPLPDRVVSSARTSWLSQRLVAPPRPGAAPIAHAGPRLAARRPGRLSRDGWKASAARRPNAATSRASTAGSAPSAVSSAQDLRDGEIEHGGRGPALAACRWSPGSSPARGRRCPHGTLAFILPAWTALAPRAPSSSTLSLLDVTPVLATRPPKRSPCAIRMNVTTYVSNRLTLSPPWNPASRGGLDDRGGAARASASARSPRSTT